MNLPPTYKAARLRKTQRGFTLIELMIVIVIIGILAAMGIGAYATMVDKARVVDAIGDIKAIQYAINDYVMVHGALPASLADVGEDGRDDPWGQPYVYQVLEGAPPGAARKDKNLVPINTDYDLYSIGKDGKTSGALTAAVSHDDIVRGNNGGFIGLATNY